MSLPPVSLGGYPLEPLGGAVPPSTSAPPPAARAADLVSLRGEQGSSPVMQRPSAAASGPALQPSPRPWPPSFPDTSAWPLLAGRGVAELAGGLLTSGAVGAGLLPFLEEAAGKAPRQPRGSWDAEATGKGWRIPRNPSRRPVQPRHAFEVREGTDDLGPLEIVSSVRGRLRALRLQWPEEYMEPAIGAQKAVLHDVLTRMASDLEVHVVAEGRADVTVRGLLAEWGVPNPQRVHVWPMRLRSSPDLLYNPLTMWARDGALLMREEVGRGGARPREVLLLPRSFRGDGQVSASLNRVVVEGTGAAPACLGQAVPDLIVRRSTLLFEGGDVVAGGRAVLLGGLTVAATMAALKLPHEAVIERFEQELGRAVVVVDPQPEFHVDLGFSFLDDDLVAVADPRLGERLAGGRADERTARMIAATREKGLADRYDAAARRLEDAGWRTVRLPTLAGVGLSTPYATYNNALFEDFTEGGRRVRRVFMPTYELPPLDEAAREVYRAHGWSVVDMPSSRLSTVLWGALRCATGELRVDA